MPDLTLVAPSRNFTAAQAWAERSPLDRALRAYFLRSQDARRALREGQSRAAGMLAERIETIGQMSAARAAAGEDVFTPLAARCFDAVDELGGRFDGEGFRSVRDRLAALRSGSPIPLDAIRLADRLNAAAAPLSPCGRGTAGEAGRVRVRNADDDGSAA